MAEEADAGSHRRFPYDDDVAVFDIGVNEDSRVLDWEDGLPSDEDLSPLSLFLVPPVLAFAFSIPPVDFKTQLDVNRAAQKTISTLNLGASDGDDRPMFLDAEDPDEFRLRSEEAVDSSTLPGEKLADDQRAVKRPRLAWTPHLHKRFVDVVAHLGIRNVVPKTIMEMMNVEGLTRENVASHLQKYRLYVKRMQGCSDESFSDHLSASTAAPQKNLHDQQQQLSKLVQVPYTLPTAIPMPIYSIPHHYSHGIVPFDNHQAVPGGYNGFDAHLLMRSEVEPGPIHPNTSPQGHRVAPQGIHGQSR
ncbi:Two-component response regulator ARR1 [Platanthera guangdongensis]|uniref:Two-component response regulator ARR1 n=1 Tax=Platanthera guangdongensis TaxID=2320717 RepID=A0ABR2MBY2_9ASPA